MRDDEELDADVRRALGELVDTLDLLEVMLLLYRGASRRAAWWSGSGAARGRRRSDTAAVIDKMNRRPAKWAAGARAACP